jgi:hypothetical protein
MYTEKVREQASKRLIYVRSGGKYTNGNKMQGSETAVTHTSNKRIQRTNENKKLKVLYSGSEVPEYMTQGEQADGYVC